MRVKTGYIRRRKHKKIKKMARGYFGQKHSSFKRAKEQVFKSLQYAFAHRRKKKGDFRRLWIIRINAAIRNYGLNYSKFIHLLQEKNVHLSRKMLAELAVRDKSSFEELVKQVTS